MSDASNNITSLSERRQKQKAKCPQCGAQPEKPHVPFCSRRCAQLDLGLWLNEEYRIPAHEAAEDEDIEALLAAAEKDINPT